MRRLRPLPRLPLCRRATVSRVEPGYCGLRVRVPRLGRAGPRVARREQQIDVRVGPAPIIFLPDEKIFWKQSLDTSGMFC